MWQTSLHVRSIAAVDYVVYAMTQSWVQHVCADGPNVDIYRRLGTMSRWPYLAGRLRTSALGVTMARIMSGLRYGMLQVRAAIQAAPQK